MKAEEFKKDPVFPLLGLRGRKGWESCCLLLWRRSIYCAYSACLVTKITSASLTHVLGVAPAWAVGSVLGLTYWC